MKKIMKYMLIFTIIIYNILNMSVCIYAEKSSEYSDEMLNVAQNILTDLGFWKDFTDDETYITRAEVAELMCMINQSTGDWHGYLDVPYDHRQPFISAVFVDEVERLGKNVFRLMSGDGNGYFRPDDFITYQEFIKVLVTHLCWGTYMTFNENGHTADYPHGYIKIAELLGLYPIDESKYTAPLTKDDAVILLYNTLKAPATRYKKTEYGIWRETYDWVEGKKGLVQVRGYCKNIDENTLEIDGVKYVGTVNSDNFTEGYVIAYCGLNGETDNNEIFTCYPVSSLNFDNPKAVSEELPSGAFQIM